MSLIYVHKEITEKKGKSRITKFEKKAAEEAYYHRHRTRRVHNFQMD